MTLHRAWPLVATGLLLAAAGCSGDAAAQPPSDAGDETPVEAGDAAPDALDASDADAADAGPCADDDAGPGELPTHLACAGLYSDIAKKTVAADVLPYAPGVSFWSDGAEKQRWIYLPPGQKIDTTDMDEWKFPVGTRTFKEFKVGGKRIETRVFYKRGTTDWTWTTYRWTDDETDATRADDGEKGIAGTYEIPDHLACDQCHGGRKDKVLGVEAIASSLAAAQGVTLEWLASQGRLTSPPPKTQATLPEDATGKAGPALGYLHMNCGVTCHNRNQNAGAFFSGLYMRLPAADVLGGGVADGGVADGGVDVTTLDTWTTAVGVAPQSADYATYKNQGYQRITPGDASKSLVVELVSFRGTGQMPPIVSHAVDDAGVATLSDWIDAE